MRDWIADIPVCFQNQKVEALHSGPPPVAIKLNEISSGGGRGRYCIQALCALLESENMSVVSGWISCLRFLIAFK